MFLLDSGQGFITAETLRQFVRQADCGQGIRGGTSSSERQRLKELERENREFKWANDALRKSSAYFAQAKGDGQTFLGRPK